MWFCRHPKWIISYNTEAIIKIRNIFMEWPNIKCTLRKSGQKKFITTRCSLRWDFLFLRFCIIWCEIRVTIWRHENNLSHFPSQPNLREIFRFSMWASCDDEASFYIRFTKRFKCDAESADAHFSHLSLYSLHNTDLASVLSEPIYFRSSKMNRNTNEEIALSQYTEFLVDYATFMSAQSTTITDNVVARCNANEMKNWNNLDVGLPLTNKSGFISQNSLAMEKTTWLIAFVWQFMLNGNVYGVCAAAHICGQHSRRINCSLFLCVDLSHCNRIFFSLVVSSPRSPLLHQKMRPRSKHDTNGKCFWVFEPMKSFHWKPFIIIHFGECRM